ncbi:hypothetical protein QFZ43_003399 [Streptomyces afghaniensis]|nr:hypothetical protein [Streptomyces afghaniensis]
MAELREDGLRVELHAPQRPRPVPQAHQDAVLRPGRGLQHLRQRFAHGQRVVADGGEILRQALEQIALVMPDRGEMPVPRLRRGPHHPPLPERDPLMAETHAEHRNRGGRDQPGRDAEVTRVRRVSGPRGDHQVVELPEIRHPVHGGVVADDHRLLAVDLGDQLEQVVRVRVVIVDEQGLHPPTSLCSFAGLHGPAFVPTAERLERRVQPFPEETLEPRHENPGDKGRHAQA